MKEKLTNLGEDMLNMANTLVSTDRQREYGHALVDFTKTAGILTSLGFKFTPADSDKAIPIDAAHIPIMMIAVKLSRLVNKEDCFHTDSFVDICGYVKTAGLVKERRDQLKEINSKLGGTK
jgi:hypothetical protein